MKYMYEMPDKEFPIPMTELKLKVAMITKEMITFLKHKIK